MIDYKRWWTKYSWLKYSFFCCDTYYYVKAWIIVVHDYVILKEFKILKKWKSNLTLIPFVVVLINMIAPLRQTKTSNSKNEDTMESKKIVIYK
jgi:hypothetical protein